MPTFATVATRQDVRGDRLEKVLEGLNKPYIFKGLVSSWPSVVAGRNSGDVLLDYLKSCASPKPCETFRQASGDGKFFYDEGGSGFNFQRASIPLAATLERLRQLQDKPGEEHIYIQSALLKDYMPSFKAQNSLKFTQIDAEPRIWIGNRSVTQIHFDLYENLVCMVSGRKRFILFPPDQVRNLYMGPLENTVSGVPTSMVNFENPDLALHPRFTTALQSASVADLEPGDVLFIPYMWWHHVISSDNFNVQVNYWWNRARPELGQPIHALFHAILALRDLPADQNLAWKAMFDHFVFHQSDPCALHLEPKHRGLLGEIDDDQRIAIRHQLGKNLMD